MFNKSRKKFYVVLLVLSLFSLSFGIGHLVMNRDNENNIVDNDIDNEQQNVEIIGEENIITPSTFIEKRTNYKECGHTESEIELADDSVINLTKEEYENHINLNTNYRMISFSNTKITIWGERNHLCTNHYIIGENEGNIAVFGIDEDGNRFLKQVYEGYHINLLQDLDKEKIINGIIVDSQDELSEVLENFIS